MKSQHPITYAQLLELRVLYSEAYLGLVYKPPGYYVIDAFMGSPPTRKDEDGNTVEQDGSAAMAWLIWRERADPQQLIHKRADQTCHTLAQRFPKTVNAATVLAAQHIEWPKDPMKNWPTLSSTGE